MWDYFFHVIYGFNLIKDDFFCFLRNLTLKSLNFQVWKLPKRACRDQNIASKLLAINHWSEFLCKLIVTCQCWTCVDLSVLSDTASMTINFLFWDFKIELENWNFRSNFSAFSITFWRIKLLFLNVFSIQSSMISWCKLRS